MAGSELRVGGVPHVAAVDPARPVYATQRGPIDGNMVEESDPGWQ